MSETSLPALLRERASLHPDDTAFTFIDYEADSGGVAESLTWLQVSSASAKRRTRAKALCITR